MKGNSVSVSFPIFFLRAAPWNPLVSFLLGVLCQCSQTVENC